MYQLIIFDWDGTIMDSAQKIANCVKASARDLGLKEPTDQEAKNIIGLGLREGMALLFSDQDDAMVDRIVDCYKHHFITNDKTEQSLFEGVEQGLHTLNENGVLLAVATGKARRGLTRVFDEVGLQQYFTVTRCADETRSKPHPQMLHEILDFTAIDPRNSIMVGDTTYDMDMAANAGMHGLGCSYGVHTEEALRQAAAVDVLDSFNNVVSWLMNDRLVRAYG
ncbi:MAG: HAD-IIIA family hydrolase [Pseudomonadota bacterium]